MIEIFISKSFIEEDDKGYEIILRTYNDGVTGEITIPGYEVDFLYENLKEIIEKNKTKKHYQEEIDRLREKREKIRNEIKEYMAKAAANGLSIAEQ